MDDVFPNSVAQTGQKQYRLYEDRPGLYQYLDYPDVTSLAMPAAFLVINGSKDTLFAQDGVRASFDKLNACYKKAGIPDKCRTRMYDTPHEFNQKCKPRRGSGSRNGCDLEVTSDLSCFEAHQRNAQRSHHDLQCSITYGAAPLVPFRQSRGH
jgi:hypothetical protein